MSELKPLLPCPFCGAETAELSEEHPGIYMVLCNIVAGGCGASSALYEDKEEPIAAWNTRHYRAVFEGM